MEKLINKQTKDYNYISRYATFPYYYNIEDEKYIYGTTSQLRKDTLYILYKVKKNDTLDSLALKFYNNPTLFWAIADFNDIQDPYLDLIEDTQLKIPNITSIAFKEI